MIELPEGFDERLWVEVEGLEGRLYLGYNPHTGAGRISAWSPAIDDTIIITKDSISEASEMVWAWVEGYLSGSEPGIEIMFGDRIWGYDDSDWRWERWRSALRRFHETGDWLEGRWISLRPFEEGVALPELVWTIRGEEVWQWASDRWRVADPQPEWVSGDFFAGSTCGEREAHGGDGPSDGNHVVCPDCGHSTEVGWVTGDGFAQE